MGTRHTRLKAAADKIVKMSAHFSKLETVNLTDEEDSGSEVEGDGQRRGGEEEGYQVKLVVGGKRSRGWKERLRRRRGKGRGGGGGSCVNSWRWVFIALVAFSVSIVISLMVAKLSSEPPPVQEDATPTSLKGEFHVNHVQVQVSCDCHVTVSMSVQVYTVCLVFHQSIWHTV